MLAPTRGAPLPRDITTTTHPPTLARSYNECMERNRDAYFAAGVYLVVERLQMLVYRTTFKKICAQLVALTGSVQLRLPLIHAGLVAAGCAADVDLDEVECLLANLIFTGLIRGYISQKARVLVLAKSNAFRPLPALLAAGLPSSKVDAPPPQAAEAGTG